MMDVKFDNKKPLTQEEKNEVLLTCARHGLLNGCRLALQEGADIHARDKAVESSALHCAARNGFTNVASFLLENGADIEAKNLIDQTPFWLSYINLKKEMAIFLVAHGANVGNSKTYNADSAITIGQVKFNSMSRAEAAIRGDYKNILQAEIEKPEVSNQDIKDLVKLSKRLGKPELVAFIHSKMAQKAIEEVIFNSRNLKF